TTEAGVTPMIVDRTGAIQAHPDDRRIAFGSGATGEASAASTLASLFNNEADRSMLTGRLRAAEASPGEVQVFEAELDGKRQLIALSYLEALGWHLVTAVDLNTAHIVQGRWLAAALAALFAVVVLLLAAFTTVVQRLLVR